jgi:chemotaxis protein methyltransferase CheR
VLAVDNPPVLTDQELAAIIKLVYEKSGITLNDGKRALVTARLQKRLRSGGFTTFSAYLKHVAADRSGKELCELLDAIATNHTSFFREPQHFEFLRTRVLPTVAGRSSKLSIWSAACSTGEEPFTLGMELCDHLPEMVRPQIRILASDLSTKALRGAREAVYRMDRVEGLPRELLRRHFERGMGAQDGLVRVAPHVRKLVEFRQLNLLEIDHLGEMFDVVFCRNVMIYFDQAVQQRVVQMLERHVVPGGFLFISHSESLNRISHGLQWAAPAVYQRRRV